MIEELKEWAKKVSLNKKSLDKQMFDDLFKLILIKLEKEGYEKTYLYLDENYTKGRNGKMVGVRLLSNNSKLIQDKLWSLNRK